MFAKGMKKEAQICLQTKQEDWSAMAAKYQRLQCVEEETEDHNHNHNHNLSISLSIISPSSDFAQPSYR